MTCDRCSMEHDGVSCTEHLIVKPVTVLLGFALFSLVWFVGVYFTVGWIIDHFKFSVVCAALLGLVWGICLAKRDD